MDWIQDALLFAKSCKKNDMVYFSLENSQEELGEGDVFTIRLLIKGTYLDMDFVTSCSDSDMLCLRFLLWVCAFEALSLTFVLVLLFSDGVILPWPKEGCLERKGKPETTCIEWRLLGLACISLDL